MFTSLESPDASGGRGRPGPRALLRALLCAGMLVCPYPAVAEWDIHTVEAPHMLTWSSMSLDPLGNPGVAYGQDALYYASWDGASWTVETVEPLCDYDSRGPSLTHDADASPAISYHDASSDSLKLARRGANGWTIEVVAAGGTHSSIALDGTGSPVIAYRGSTGALQLARRSGASWEIEVVDPADSAFPSLAFDAAGRPAISYHCTDDMNQLRLARWTGSDWTLENVDPFSYGQSTTLLFEANGNPLIGYTSGFGSSWPFHQLRLARWDGSGWAIETIDYDSFNASLALDAVGNPVFSYHIGSDGWPIALKLAVWDGSAWNLEWVAPLDGGGTTSLALDAEGRPHICYASWSERSLEWARKDGSLWEIEQIDRFGWVGRFNSLAVDPAGTPTVAYADEYTFEQKFARWDGSSWDIEVVDSAAGGHTSLAYDHAGNPTMAYHDRVHDELVFARLEGGGWDIQVVDTDGGSNCSLAHDGSGNPAIAYNGGPMGQTQLARWDGSGWSIETVAGGWTCSLVFDGDDHPAIGLYDNEAEELWIAVWDGSDWRLELADPDGGAPCSVAVDGSGSPVLAYLDRESVEAPGLRFADWDGFRWRVESVDTEGSPGWYNSVTYDGSGQPAISYWDSTSGAIKVARRMGTSWSVESVDTSGSGMIGGETSLAFDASGRAVLSYLNTCFGDLVVAFPLEAATLHRGSVADLGTGWKASALPLTSLNDDETPPFPIASSGGEEIDEIITPDPLILYRVLGPDNTPLSTTLRAVKRPTGTALRF